MAHRHFHAHANAATGVPAEFAPDCECACQHVEGNAGVLKEPEVRECFGVVVVSTPPPQCLLS